MYNFVGFDGNESLWEDINLSISYSTFLTSSNWINFQTSLGKQIFRFYIEFNNQKVGLIHFEKSSRKISKYLYAPYSPVILTEHLNTEFFKCLHEFTKEQVIKHRVNVFRFDMNIQSSNVDFLKSNGFKKSLASVQAKDCWEIDLSQNIDSLRSEMSKSTRYNINKGLKSEIKIVEASTDLEVKEFADLMKQTTLRKGFSNFDFDYFKKQFNYLHKTGLTKIFLAKYKEESIAGALVNYYKNTAYYTHGCSTSNAELSKLRAPYPLQYTIMENSKNSGYKIYNMWGILPDRVKKHSQTGVSEFKKSFGGYQVNLVGPYESFVNPLKYFIQKIFDYFAYKNDRY